nr:DEAD-box ATP-dependent RNA helicase 8-like [Tanacetum cinerariifolium]
TLASVAVTVEVMEERVDWPRSEHVFPGRLNNSKMLVMDEANNLLSPEFQPSVEQLICFTPANCQILMFSATFHVTVKDFKESYMRKPYTILCTTLCVIRSKDEEVNDFTSQFIAKEHFDSQPLKGLRVGVISENIGDGVDQEVGVISKTRRDRGSDSAHVNHLRAPR